MAKIPGIVFLIVGIGVAVSSLIIKAKQLFIFSIVGGIMVVYGVIQMLAKKKTEPPVKYVQPPPTNHYSQGHIKYCPKCGITSSSDDFYCARCGTPLAIHRQ